MRQLPRIAAGMRTWGRSGRHFVGVLGAVAAVLSFGEFGDPVAGDLPPRADLDDQLSLADQAAPAERLTRRKLPATMADEHDRG